jgi:hypothetical protein
MNVHLCAAARQCVAARVAVCDSARVAECGSVHDRMHYMRQCA